LLGERVLNGVQFPVMKQKEFIGNVLEKKILTEEEGSGVIQYFTSGLSCLVRFSDRKRVNPQPCHRCVRFQSVSDLRASRRDFINMRLSKNILLHGVSLFGVAANTGVEIKNAILGSNIVTKSMGKKLFKFITCYTSIIQLLWLSSSIRSASGVKEGHFVSH